jgi:hypothetical protein
MIPAALELVQGPKLTCKPFILNEHCDWSAVVFHPWGTAKVLRGEVFLELAVVDVHELQMTAATTNEMSVIADRLQFIGHSRYGQAHLAQTRATVEHQDRWPRAVAPDMQHTAWNRDLKLLRHDRTVTAAPASPGGPPTQPAAFGDTQNPRYRHIPHRSVRSNDGPQPADGNGTAGRRSEVPIAT